MPKQPTRSKTLFSVGRNKASPARTASTRRASLRRSVIPTEASHLRLGDTEGERGGTGLATMHENDDLRAPTRESLQKARGDPEIIMKDVPLPPLPADPASAPRIIAGPPLSHHDGHPPPSSMNAERISHTSSPSRPPQPRANMNPPSRPQGQQSGIFKRLTLKFRSSPSSGQPPKSSRDAPQQDAPRRKSTVLRMPSMPKAPVPAAPPNDFTSAERRQAALRARGLIPATPAVPRRFRGADGFMMSLSEQEAEIDRRFSIMVPGKSSMDEDAESEATKIREAWLAKQTEASGSKNFNSRETDAVEAATRRSDAVQRASRDGTIGERSPVHATFVAGSTLLPNVGEIGSDAPIEATVEDFHTAPNTPVVPDEPLPSDVADIPLVESAPSSTAQAQALRSSSTAPAPSARTKEQQYARPSNPSSHSSAVGEKVSRWLRTSSDLPAPPAGSTAASAEASTFTAGPALTEFSRPSLTLEDSMKTPVATSLPVVPNGSGTMRARKEKPPPIIVTSHHRQSHDNAGKVPTQVIAVAIAAPSDSEASTSEGRPSLQLDTRGRSHSHGMEAAAAPALMHRLSTRSRTTTVPALSPTRTVSSSGASSALPTPTTTSCVAREPSISRSSDNGHDGAGTVRARRGTGSKGAMPSAAVIMEEYSETEPSSEGGEFGMATARPPMPPPGARPSQESPVAAAAAVPRPARVQTLEQAAGKQQNRKSFSLFGKKSLDIPRETRNASSMSNLRRAFTSSKQRSKSTLDPAVAQGGGGEQIGKKRSKMFDASHLPASPTSAVGHLGTMGRTPGVGLRPPRRAVAPTMHSHGTILHQANFIEDEESRRLSEMAFLT